MAKHQKKPEYIEFEIEIKLLAFKLHIKFKVKR